MIETRYTADDLKKLPLRAIVAFAARCARRVEHLALPPEGDADREALRSSVAEALRVAEDFARGRPCPTAESAIRAVEAGQAPAEGDPVRASAHGAVVRAIHAAAAAAHAVELHGEPEERPLVGGGPPSRAVPHLANVSADLASLGAYTAAIDAAEAMGHAHGFTMAVAEDYRKLVALGLGQYPAAGHPVDPSPDGPLGPIGPWTPSKLDPSPLA